MGAPYLPGTKSAPATAEKPTAQWLSITDASESSYTLFANTAAVIATSAIATAMMGRSRPGLVAPARSSAVAPNNAESPQTEAPRMRAAFRLHG